MKNLITRILVFLWANTCVYAQQLNATDLGNLIEKGSKYEIDKSLSNKGYTFFKTREDEWEGSHNHIWAYRLNPNTQKAPLWLHYFTYEYNAPKIVYKCVNDDHIKYMLNSISSAGYIQKKVEEERLEKVTTYMNSKYILKITTERESYYTKDIVSLYAEITRKSDVLAEANGKRVLYFEDTRNIQEEYSVKNNVRHGLSVTYHENGQKESEGNYEFGKRQGVFKYYNEEGNLESEIPHKQDQIDGMAKFYGNGLLFRTATIKEGEARGEMTTFLRDENGRITQKIIQNYVGDFEHGPFYGYLIDDKGQEILVARRDYVNDELEGDYLELSNDTLYVTKYKKGVLDGPFIAYTTEDDVPNRMLSISDSVKMQLFVKGSFKNGLKDGKWQYYDLYNAITMEGTYVNGLEEGEWREYVPTIKSGIEMEEFYSNKLRSVYQYVNGKLHGKKTDYLTSTVALYQINSDPDDPEYKFIYDFEEIEEVSYYKNGVLHGLLEGKDQEGEYYIKGFYKEGKREGEWLIRSITLSLEDTLIEKGFYVNNMKHGKWNITKNDGAKVASLNHKNDVLHGIAQYWGSDGALLQEVEYDDSKLSKIFVIGEDGINIVNEYHIYGRGPNYHTCRLVRYIDPTSIESTELKVENDAELDHFQYVNYINDGINGNLKDNRKVTLWGEQKFTDKNGVTYFIGHYKDNKKDGLWTYFYPDQNVKLERNYKRDVVEMTTFKTLEDKFYSGSVKGIYFEKENRKYVIDAKVKDGLLNGKVVFKHSETQEVLFKETYKKGIN